MTKEIEQAEGDSKMCRKELAKSYFEKAVIKYSKKDVEILLVAHDHVGPLLEVIVNGVDNLDRM